jgi:NAD(P)-dependent dehydrogenase (short-subunit alcohol dehydrogenase family)
LIQHDAASEVASVLDLFRLDGRVAIVTGASSGLGAGFARALAEAGADVAIAARRLDRLKAIQADVADRGRRCVAVETDVCDPDAADRLVKTAVQQLGSVDVLVNNAGVTSMVPATRETPAEFRHVLDVNLAGAYWVAQACGRVMRPGSSIVNIASVLGLVKSLTPAAAYAASKAGLIGLTRDLSAQWAGRKGIRVNALAPGFVQTDMIGEMPGELLEAFLRTGSLGRTGTQREMDAALLFLASPASSYVTGITLAVDGGMSGH